MTARRVPWALRGALCHNLVDSRARCLVRFVGLKEILYKMQVHFRFGTCDCIIIHIMFVCCMHFVEISSLLLYFVGV